LAQDALLVKFIQLAYPVNLPTVSTVDYVTNAIKEFTNVIYVPSM